MRYATNTRMLHHHILPFQRFDAIETEITCFDLETFEIEDEILAPFCYILCS